MIVRSFQREDEKPVVALWEECGLIKPWNDPRRDIQRKLQVAPELFLVGALNREIIASVMGGYEGHRGWINYLAVKPYYQRHGFGKKIMEVVEKLLVDRGCPKINLQVRSINTGVINFYMAVGFIQDDVVSLGKRIIND